MEWRQNHFEVGPADNATYGDGTKVPVGAKVIPIAAYPNSDARVWCRVCGNLMKPVLVGGSFIGWHCTEYNHGPARLGEQRQAPPARPLTFVSGSIQGDLVTAVFRLPS